MKRLTLFLVWVGSAAAVFAVSFAAQEPAIYPDELCHLGWARLLSGKGSFYSMGFAGYCEPGYGLLIAPLYLIFSGNAGVYSGIIALNALIVSTSILLAKTISVRHLKMSVPQGWAAGVLFSLYPGVVTYAGFALPEALLYLLTLTWFAAWSHWIDTKTKASLALVMIASSALFATHSRMIIFVLLPLLIACITLLLARTNRNLRASALTILLIGGITLLTMHSIKQWAVPLGWSADPLIALDRIASLTAPDLLLNVMAKFGGEILFAMFASVGLACVPIAWAASYASGFSEKAQLAGPTPLDLKMLPAPIMLVALAVEGAIFLGKADRFDIFFYGRYIGPMLSMSLVVGLALITQDRAKPSFLCLSIIVAACSILTLLAGPKVPYSDYSRIHVVGALPIVDWLSRSESSVALSVKLAATAGLLTLLAGALTRRHWAWYAGTVMIAIVVVNIFFPYTRGKSALDHFSAEVTQLLASHECVVEWPTSADRLQNHQLFRLQYLFPDCEIVQKETGHCNAEGTSITVVAAESQCAKASRYSLPLEPGLLVIAPVATRNGVLSQTHGDAARNPEIKIY